MVYKCYSTEKWYLKVTILLQWYLRLTVLLQWYLRVTILWQWYMIVTALLKQYLRVTLLLNRFSCQRWPWSCWTGWGICPQGLQSGCKYYRYSQSCSWWWFCNRANTAGTLKAALDDDFATESQNYNSKVNRATNHLWTLPSKDWRYVNDFDPRKSVGPYLFVLI